MRAGASERGYAFAGALDRRSKRRRKAVANNAQARRARQARRRALDLNQVLVTRAHQSLNGSLQLHSTYAIHVSGDLIHINIPHKRIIFYRQIPG